MSWTDERVELLTKLWADGLSAYQISCRLGGGVSRSAVIGKVHRLGLSGRVTVSRVSKARTYIRKTRQKFVRARRDVPKWLTDVDTSAPVIEPHIPVHERKSLLDLEDASCRWPIGDPQHPDFAFCGRKKADGIPYCVDHARIAYAPPSTKVKRPFIVREKFTPEREREKTGGQPA